MNSAIEIIKSSSREYRTHWRLFLLMTLFLILPLFLFRINVYPDYPFSAFKLFLWASPLEISGIDSPFAIDSFQTFFQSLPYLLADGLLIPITVFLPVVQLFSANTARPAGRFLTNTAGKIPQLLLLQLILIASRLLCFLTLTGLHLLFGLGIGSENKSFLPWICLLIFAVCLALCIILPFWIIVSGFAGFSIICENKSAPSAVKRCIRLVRKHFFTVLWTYFKINFLFWLPYAVLFLITSRALAQVFGTGADLTLYFSVYVLLYAALYPIKVRSMMYLVETH